MSQRVSRTIGVVIAVVLATVVAVTAIPSASAAKGGRGHGRNAVATAADVVAVPDTSYGSTVVATATSGSEDRYVFVQCYTPDLDGEYVYAAYFQVVDDQATIGPLWSTLWPRSDATCTAELGYATRDGWGRWEAITSSTFHVTAEA